MSIDKNQFFVGSSNGHTGSNGRMYRTCVPASGVLNIGAVRRMPCSVRTFGSSAFARVVAFFFAFGVSVFGSVWRLRVFIYSENFEAIRLVHFSSFLLSEALLRFRLIPRCRNCAGGGCPSLFATGFFFSVSFQEFAESFIALWRRIARDIDVNVVESYVIRHCHFAIFRAAATAREGIGCAFLLRDSF